MKKKPSQSVSAFLHELSQPMTAARGALEMALLLSNSIEEYRQAIQEAISHIDRMATMKFKMGLEASAAEGESSTPQNKSQSTSQTTAA